jgi:superfamily II DNA or RNA helicase
MESILSKNGYKIKKKSLTPKSLKSLKDELSVKPYVYNDYNNTCAESRFQVFLESPNSIYIPKFYGIEKYGMPQKIKMNSGNYIDIKFNGDLRPEQKPIEEIYLKSANEIGGGIISLKCGGGKTVLALHIISMLKKKTIVIVHKDFLMTQWYDRIKQFLPDAKIGKIQQNTIDIENKDIVLSMVQSLSMKEYPEDTFTSFGLAVFDECHHLGAEVFSKSMQKVSSKYMLGLSATPNRKDGLRKVFEWYIGPVVYMTKDKNEDYVEVQLIKYDSSDQKYCKEEKTFKGDACMPRMINNICEYYPRTKMILDLVDKYYKESRKILILSDRREHLNIMEKYIHEYIAPNNVGQYVGGMKPSQLHLSQEKDIILGTFSMASEGMDIPKLNTCILVSPKSDVEQSVGRIFREKACDRTHHPLIVDIIDDFSLFTKQADKRQILYRKMNFKLFMDGIEVTKKKTTRKKKEIDIYEITECLID